MKKIRSCITWLNVISAIIAAGLSTVFYFDIQTGGLIIVIFNILVTLALIGSVLHIRRTISQTDFVFPNEQIVVAHLTVFAIWSITTGVWQFLLMK